MRRLALASVLVAVALGLGGAPACSSDDPPAPGARLDAGAEAGDARADASAPTGSICGDTSGLDTSGWPMRGGCPKRPSSTEFTAPPSPQQTFKTPLDLGPAQPVVAKDGVIAAVAADGSLLVSGPDGKKKGQYPVGASPASGPVALADQSLLVATADGKLLQVSLEGVTSWTISIGTVGVDPVVARGRVFVGGADGSVTAVPLGAAAAAWTNRDAKGATTGASVDDDGTVVFGSADGKLRALTAEGAPKWSFDADGKILHPPAIGRSGSICFGTDAGTIFVVGPDGKERLRDKTGGAITTGCAIGPDATMIAGSADKSLYAIGPDGKRAFVYRTLGAPGSPVVDPEGTVVFGSEDTKLYAVGKSGLLRWAQSAGSPVRAQPAPSPNAAVVVAADKALFAFGQ